MLQSVVKKNNSNRTILFFFKDLKDTKFKYFQINVLHWTNVLCCTAKNQLMVLDLCTNRILNRQKFVLFSHKTIVLKKTYLKIKRLKNFYLVCENISVEIHRIYHHCKVKKKKQCFLNFLKIEFYFILFFLTN